MDSIIDSLLPYKDMAVTALNEATTEQLAIASFVGLIGLYVLLSKLFFPVFIATVAIGYAYAFYVAPTAAAFSLMAVLIVYGSYARWVFGEWETAFAGHRLTRRNEACPSNSQLPDIKT